MSGVKDGGPAFPMQGTNIIDHPNYGMIATDAQSGMSLRDWFAGQALAGYVAHNPESLDVDLARVAYNTADAMLVQRGKGGAE